MSYVDRIIDPSPEDLDTRSQFIARLGELGVRKPTLMQNDDGQVGFYWDDDRFYADVDLDEDNTFSVFSRDRQTNSERFVETVTIDQLTQEWVDAELGPQKSC